LTCDSLRSKSIRVNIVRTLIRSLRVKRTGYDGPARKSTYM